MKAPPIKGRYPFTIYELSKDKFVRVTDKGEHRVTEFFQRRRGGRLGKRLSAEEQTESMAAVCRQFERALFGERCA